MNTKTVPACSEKNVTDETTLISGSSDNTIEITGKCGCEFTCCEDWQYLHFDDGTIVKGGFVCLPGKGWHFEVVAQGEESTVRYLQSEIVDGEHFTDRLELTGDISKVACWGQANGPSDLEIEVFFDIFNCRRYTAEKLRAAFMLFNTVPINNGQDESDTTD